MKIETKYNIGDIVLLLNGKMREIKAIDIYISDYCEIRYQGSWYTPFFNENQIVELKAKSNIKNNE